jgi:hypothetical protein
MVSTIRSEFETPEHLLRSIGNFLHIEQLADTKYHEIPSNLEPSNLLLKETIEKH